MCDHLFPDGGNDLKWERLGKQGCCFIGKQQPRCFIDALAPRAAGKSPGLSRPNLPVLEYSRT